jgi:hypothetical protein
MLGVTVFGIFFTPVFYVVIRWLTSLGRAAPEAPLAVEAADAPPGDGAPASHDGATGIQREPRPHGS